MKKIVLLCLAVCAAIAVSAQELPYSKYLNYSNKQLKENCFKYHKNTNTWVLSKSDGWGVALNVLAIVADAYDDIRPSRKDYSIAVQMGKDEKVSSVRVLFYDDDTYHKLLAFVKTNGKDLLETSSGKLVKQHALYGDYHLELEMEQHLITRTSNRTIDYRSVKSVDRSYNEYSFAIETTVAPWSKYLDKQAAKQAKRDAKGKKKNNVADLM